MLGFETWTVDNGGNGKNDGKWTTGLTGEEGIEVTEETMFAIVSGCWVIDDGGFIDVVKFSSEDPLKSVSKDEGIVEVEVEDAEKDWKDVDVVVDVDETLDWVVVKTSLEE